MQKALCRAATFPQPATDSQQAGAFWLPLVPKGDVIGRDGRAWKNDNVEDVINHTELPFMLDTDHESELSHNTQAKGWFTELRFNEDTQFIEGLLELNDLGRQAVEQKHYKYYSPCIVIKYDYNNHH